MPDIFSLLKSLGNVDITRYSDSEILTPQNIVSDMVDLLPQEVFNPDTTFLDPAVKSGRFLKEIYNRLFNSPLLSYMNEKERREHILHNQLFGLATSPTAATLSRAMLYDTAVYRGNIVYADNYIARVSNSKGKDIKKIIEGAFAKDMTFDIVIGNPPYQNGSTSIYPYFIEAALCLAPRVCMITKDNWIESEVLKSTREKMILAGISDIVHYPIPSEVFNTVGVSVAIFYIDRVNETNTHYRSVRNKKLDQEYTEDLTGYSFIPCSKCDYTITKKVKPSSETELCKNMAPTMPFGIETNGKLGHSKLGLYVSTTSKADVNHTMPILWSDGDASKPYFLYGNELEIEKNKHLIKKYKAICSRVINKNSTVICGVWGLKPGQICTGSFSVIYSSDSLELTVNVIKYLQTKFVRYLVRMINGQMNRISPYRFSLVPDQDFSSNSDIDWSQTVADIDKQLYKKYNLFQEEIDYIVQTINPYD